MDGAAVPTAGRTGDSEVSKLQEKIKRQQDKCVSDNCCKNTKKRDVDESIRKI